MAEVMGQESSEFEDHMPYSNKGMKDLLKLDEVVSTIWTEIILLRSNKIIEAQTPLVLFGTSLSVSRESLHQEDNVLSQRLHF